MFISTPIVSVYLAASRPAPACPASSVVRGCSAVNGDKATTEDVTDPAKLLSETPTEGASALKIVSKDGMATVICVTKSPGIRLGEEESLPSGLLADVRTMGPALSGDNRCGEVGDDSDRIIGRSGGEGPEDADGLETSSVGKLRTKFGSV